MPLTFETKFHSMQELPEREHKEDFSKTVLLYDENDYVDLGYYSFDTKEWVIFGDMSMKIICWSYPPNPRDFILENKNLKPELHRGYRP